MQSQLLSIIIPVYNEQTFVQLLLEKLLSIDFHGHGRDTEWIIVNDGSKDNSEKLILNFMTDHPDTKITYHNQTNTGKWGAVKKWFSLAKGDVLVIQDADLEYDPGDLLEWLKKLLENDYDYIYGSRIRGFHRYGFTYSTVPFLLGGLLVSFVSSLWAMQVITDEPTCYKMFRKSCQKYLQIPSENGFEWEPAITILLSRLWMRYGERPIKYFPRKTSAGKKIKFKDGFIALWTLVKRRLKDISSFKK